MDRIDAMLAAAAQAWPGVVVDPARFRAYVAERVDGALDERALADRRLDDLYLACACADGDERAAALFRNTFQAAIAATAARAAPQHLCDEICQLVHAKLLVADEDRPPAIASYLGVGKLSTWVQVVAARVARSRIRSENRHGGAADRDDVDELVDRASSEDALLESLKSNYRVDFKKAFRVALERLSPRERNLLRYECIDGLTRDEIAKLYAVSRATVARWRAACRTRLHDETLAAFRELCGVGVEELESVVAMIQSQLEVSLSRLLADHQPPSSD